MTAEGMGPRPEGDACHSACIRVAMDHPALPGHFPGTPIVPGVVLLDRVLEAAERLLGRPLSVDALPQAKFPAPLLPGEEALASIHLEGGRLAFEVERDGHLLARGVFRLASSELPSPPDEGGARGAPGADAP